MPIQPRRSSSERDPWFFDQTSKRSIRSRVMRILAGYQSKAGSSSVKSKEGDSWKVRLIEEDFVRLMWDAEDV